MARVKLDQITRRYGVSTAIHDITFEVPDGEFWVMVGPSGCGKSTILRTIAGLETETSGDLWLGQQRVNGIPARQRDVAMVFQNYALYPHMSVAENLAFGLRMRQANPATIRDRVHTVAQSLNIAHLLDRKPRQLSGGQQQRVALGRAIARQPQAFLLDEPLSNLDAQLRDDTRAELKQLHRQVGITTIYVTHDQVEAMTLADQIVVLDQGTVQQIGSPHAIYNQPINRMVATFIGNPPMNIIPVNVEGGQFRVSSQHLPCPERLNLEQGQPVDLGIRPEFIQITSDKSNTDIEVVITVVEPLGRETLIRADLPGSTLQFFAPSGLDCQPGDRVGLKLDVSQLFVFDATTGSRRLNPA
jgi:multiple sugar transport system ATP-binding protein